MQSLFLPYRSYFSFPLLTNVSKEFYMYIYHLKQFTSKPSRYLMHPLDIYIVSDNELQIRHATNPQLRPKIIAPLRLRCRLTNLEIKRSSDRRKKEKRSEMKAGKRREGTETQNKLTSWEASHRWPVLYSYA